MEGIGKEEKIKKIKGMWIEKVKRRKRKKEMSGKKVGEM